MNDGPERNARVDVMLITRTPLELLPPAVNQVRILAKHGLQVTVIDNCHPEIPHETFDQPGEVKRISVSRHVMQHKERVGSLHVRMMSALRFRNRVRREIGNLKPAVIIACEPFGGLAVGRWWRARNSPKLVWHFHEMPNHGDRFSTDSIAYRFCERYVHLSDLVVFPDEDRATIVSKRLGNSISPVIVVNCPLRRDLLPESKLATGANDGNARGIKQWVCYSGALGEKRGLETAIRSIHLWPEEVGFLMIGPIANRFKQRLVDLIELEGVQSRVVFAASVPRSELDELLVGCLLGCALVENEDDSNWKYNAGASNKRFDYMALGLPQITNNSPGLEKIIIRHQIGFLVAAGDFQCFADAVVRTASDLRFRSEMSYRARQAHLLEYNYERQFEPVLSKILAWVR